MWVNSVLMKFDCIHKMCVALQGSDSGYLDILKRCAMEKDPVTQSPMHFERSESA